MSDAPDMVAHRLRGGTKTGAWLTVMSATVNGTELGDQEWQYSLFLKFRIYTTDLHPQHDRAVG